VKVVAIEGSKVHIGVTATVAETVKRLELLAEDAVDDSAVTADWPALSS
jgi:hypothetical protein